MRVGIAGGTEADTDSKDFSEVGDVDRYEVSALIGMKSYRSVNITDPVPKHVENVVVCRWSALTGNNLSGKCAER